MTWEKEDGMRRSGTVPQTRKGETIFPFLLTSFTCIKEARWPITYHVVWTSYAEWCNWSMINVKSSESVDFPTFQFGTIKTILLQM